MLLISDFHSHILPAIDDGSKSVEESIALLEAQRAQGVEHVVLTPHFYPLSETPRDFLKRRDAAETELFMAMAMGPELPTVTVGAEVAYYGGMSESEDLKLLTLRGTTCILIEMPPAPWPKTVWRELCDIRDKQGLTPIIAHIDRYIRPMHTYGVPRKLQQLGITVQANANFFIRKETSSMALRMLKAGQIHLLGSDCHNLETRCPNLQTASNKIEQKLGREALERIRDTERKLLHRMDWNGVIK